MKLVVVHMPVHLAGLCTAQADLMLTAILLSAGIRTCIIMLGWHFTNKEEHTERGGSGTVVIHCHCHSLSSRFLSPLPPPLHPYLFLPVFVYIPMHECHSVTIEVRG